MKILVSAAEASSDRQGAAVLEALKELGPVDAFGMGGPHLQAAGLRPVIDAREMLSMGFSEVLSRLPRIWRGLAELERAAKEERPDLAVVIDYPDFHFRLAARLKKLGIPVINFIPPKVWAWRRGRVKKMARLFDRILCVLPFEEAFYREHGVSAQFVGNPLVDRLPVNLTQAEARQSLGVPVSGARVLTLFLGSRPHEIDMHAEPMIEAIRLTHAQVGGRWIILMPLPHEDQKIQVENRVRELTRNFPAEIEWRVLLDEGARCLVAAEAGIVKSGTSTLEAGILGCPHVVAYRASRSTSWLFHNVIRYTGPIGLVNLVGGWKAGDSWRPELRERIVPEVLGLDVTGEALARELLPILVDASVRDRIVGRLAEMKRNLTGTAGNAAKTVALALRGYSP